MNQSNPTHFVCYRCQKNIPVIGQFRITRTEDCPFCAAPLHCCRMCKFYDPRVYNECHETNAERLLDKEKSNFCDYFVLTDGSGTGNKKDDLLNAADALFKK